MSEVKVGDRGTTLIGQPGEVIGVFGRWLWFVPDYRSDEPFTALVADFKKEELKWEVGKSYTGNGGLPITVRWVDDSGAAVVTFIDLFGRLTSCVKPAASRKEYKGVV